MGNNILKSSCGDTLELVVYSHDTESMKGYTRESSSLHLLPSYAVSFLRGMQYKERLGIFLEIIPM